MWHYSESKVQGKRLWRIRQGFHGKGSGCHFASLELSFLSKHLPASHEISSLEPNPLKLCVPLNSSTDNQYFHGFKVTFWPPFGGTGPTIHLLIDPSPKSPVKQQIQQERSAQIPDAGARPIQRCPRWHSALPLAPSPWARAAKPRVRAHRAVLTQLWVPEVTWTVNGQVIKSPSQSFVRALWEIY